MDDGQTMRHTAFFLAADEMVVFIEGISESWTYEINGSDWLNAVLKQIFALFGYWDGFLVKLFQVTSDDIYIYPP